MEKLVLQIQIQSQSSMSSLAPYALQTTKTKILRFTDFFFFSNKALHEAQSSCAARAMEIILSVSLHFNYTNITMCQRPINEPK